MESVNGNITKLEPNEIFVFGSNTQGRHGKGSALSARQRFGAIYGQAYGRQGQSYAICTKDISSYPHKSIAKSSIYNQITKLYEYARIHSDLKFYIPYRGHGTNLNGYTPKEMAELFSQPNIPENIIFEKTFKELIK